MITVTITSDWKYGDYYLGALKGSLLSLSSGVRVVDITNSVPCYDVLQEIFILKSTFFRFPQNSIHLMAVMSEPTTEKPMVIVYSAGHYFIGINDGRFSLLFDSIPTICFEILCSRSIPYSTFLALDLFTEGVRIILENKFETETVAAELKKEYATGVVHDADSIIGRVIYCDSAGNAITNIARYLFDKLQQGRNYTIYVQGPYTKIIKISRGYHDSNPGEVIALFNSLGMLELAVNQGNIVKLENLDTSSEVRIKFEK
jgi:hypothetical protein